jgi:hypothetical protein
MVPYDPVKLAEANAILAAYLDDLVLIPGGPALPRQIIRPILLRHGGREIPLRLDVTGSRAVLPLGAGRFGGTNHEVIGQLVRFGANLTRRPLAWWERVVGYREAIEAVKTTSYLDGYKTACILCGAGGASLDWWSDRGRQGPCCFYGRCLQGAA